MNAHDMQAEKRLIGIGEKNKSRPNVQRRRESKPCPSINAAKSIGTNFVSMGNRFGNPRNKAMTRLLGRWKQYIAPALLRVSLASAKRSPRQFFVLSWKMSSGRMLKRSTKRSRA